MQRDKPLWMMWFVIRVFQPTGWEIVATKISAYTVLLYLSILVLIDSTCFIPRLLRIWDQHSVLEFADQPYAADGSD